MFDSTVRTRHRYFFRANAALTAVPVGLGGLLGAMGVIGTTLNSFVTTVTSSARILSVRAWNPQVAGSDNVFVDWVGVAGYLPDSSMDRCLPDGITVSSCLLFKPPAKSLAAAWMNSAVIAVGTAILTFTAPAGTVIEVDLEGTLCNVTGTQSIAVAAAAIGTFYYLALDGPASNKIRPVGVLSTA
jgi:hypothetical protein